MRSADRLVTALESSQADGERAAGDRAALLYDRDCGFCRWSLGVVLSWDRRARLRPVALQDPEADRLLADLDPELRMASWHLVSPDGSRRSAGSAVAPTLRVLPGGAPAAAVAERFPALTEAGYRALASHRAGLHRLIRLFGAE
jgi:predicted DCC family thiol-disulfide oxidoreductase YuxK